MLQPLSKAKLKFFSALSHKKYRNLSALFLIEGIKMVNEAVQANFQLAAIIVQEKRVNEIKGKMALEKLPCEVFVAAENDFQKLSEQVHSEGIIGVVHFPEAWKTPTIPALSSTSFWLENLQDPGNMGTILRIADWFGISQVICSPDTADFLNPKVIRASMGAIFRINIFYTDRFYELVSQNAAKIWVADMQGTPLPQAKFQGNDSVLLGNEANGISAKVKEIKGLSYVNIPKIGQAESLNVAIASGILAYQLTIQKTEN